MAYEMNSVMALPFDDEVRLPREEDGPQLHHRDRIDEIEKLSATVKMLFGEPRFTVNRLSRNRNVEMATKS
jgi:hypothetical protein